MTTFDERENRFENEFAHDQELKFRVEARRNKLVGAWAAEKLALVGDDAEAYIKEVVKSDFEEVGHEDVFRKLRKDLDGAREAVSDEEIREKMASCLHEAMDLVQAGK